MSVIEELENAVGGVAASAGVSIVGIGSRQRGSGVVVADGRVVTNAHNIRGDEVTVTFADGRSTRGSLAGVDVDGDLAVINVDTAGARPVDWADPRPSRTRSSLTVCTDCTSRRASARTTAVLWFSHCCDTPSDQPAGSSANAAAGPSSPPWTSMSKRTVRIIGWLA